MAPLDPHPQTPRETTTNKVRTKQDRKSAPVGVAKLFESETQTARDGLANTDEVLCVCAESKQEVKTNLARCKDCGLVQHKWCVVRSSKEYKGLRCNKCMGPLKSIRSGDNPPASQQPQPKRKRAAGDEQAPRKKAAKTAPTGAVESMKEDSRPKRQSRRSQAIVVEDDPDEVEPNETLANVLSTLTAVTGHVVPKPTAKKAPMPPPVAPRATTLVQDTTYALPTSTEEPPLSPARRQATFNTVLAQLKSRAKTHNTTPITTAAFLHATPYPVLWRHYCLIPPTTTTSPSVDAATMTHFHHTRTEPLRPTPHPWKHELKRCLANLLAAAELDGWDLRLTDRDWDGDAVEALKYLSEIALSLLRRDGPWNGKKGELGLFGEVVGLLEKGTVWKGGDVFVDGEGGSFD